MVIFRYAVLLYVIFMAACAAPQQLSRQNTAFTYFKSPAQLNPVYKVYHSADSVSTVYFAIKQSKLLYTKSGNKFEGKVKIRCFLFDDFDSKVPADTATFYYTFNELADTNNWVGNSFPIKAKKGKQYVAQFIFYDVNRKVYNNTLLPIDKQNVFSADYFLLRSFPDSAIIFEPYLAKNQIFTIHIANTAIQKLNLKYFAAEILPARPPFGGDAQQNLKADTVLTIEMACGQSGPQQLVSQGLYILCVDTISTFGLPITRTYDTYPQLTTAADVLKPLRYLTAKDEYAKLEKAENVKKEVDDFWLRAAGTATSARNVLKNYYTGVSFANRFFTTTREGWKTDRGMVYCIFGQPFSVYRSGNTETWLYGNGNTPFTPTFVFVKQPDGLTGYDYYLRRSDVFKPIWYDALENWRNGRLQYWY